MFVYLHICIIFTLHAFLKIKVFIYLYVLFYPLCNFKCFALSLFPYIIKMSINVIVVSTMALYIDGLYHQSRETNTYFIEEKKF